MGGQAANEELRHLAKQPQSLAISEPMQTAPSHPYQIALTHWFERSNTQRLCLFWWPRFLTLGLCKIRQTQTRLCIMSISSSVLAKCCLQQLVWLNGAVRSILRGRSQPLRNSIILVRANNTLTLIY